MPSDSINQDKNFVKKGQIGNSLQLQEFCLIKIKAQLGMGFVYKELNLCDKAMRCINEAEALNHELSSHQQLRIDSSSYTTIANETFTFSKFSINCRANDVLAAEASL